MAMPALVVALGFLVAVVAALAFMAYISWRGSKASNFFLEAVKTDYELELPTAEIEAYYEVKDRLFKQYATDEEAAALAADDDAAAAAACTLIRRLPQEALVCLQKALMKRLVACIDKLDKVQRDKPGTMKLWRGKLVSERYWGSLCEAEKMVSEEIDACTAEADELQPGWKEHIFSHGVRCWRMQKQQDMEKKVHKKAVVQEKKAVQKEEKRKENEEKMKEEEKIRQEKAAEKAMEKLLREEEKAEKASKAAKKGSTPAPKSKGKKK